MNLAKLLAPFTEGDTSAEHQSDQLRTRQPEVDISQTELYQARPRRDASAQHCSLQIPEQHSETGRGNRREQIVLALEKDIGRHMTDTTGTRHLSQTQTSLACTLTLY